MANSQINIFMKLIRNKLIMALIIFIGLFLRIYNLDKESIWVDEIISIKMVHFKLSTIIKAILIDYHPPLYYYILHYWVNLFGDSEFAIRFLSVIFGFLAIFMIYKVGSLLFNKNVGLIGSLILALSVFHIQYSQEARVYSLITLLSLISFYFFIKLFVKSNHLIWIAYVLSNALLIYSHFYGLFIVIAQNIFCISLFLVSCGLRENYFKKWFWYQGLLVILYIPYLGILIKQISKIAKYGFWLTRPSIYKIAYSFKEYSGSYFLFGFFLLLSFFSIVTYKKAEDNIYQKVPFNYRKGPLYNKTLTNANKLYLLLLWLTVPIILPFIISQFFIPVYLSRCTIVASLAFYLLIANGIGSLSNKKYLKLFIMSLIVFFSLVNIQKYYKTVNKEQWREVADYIDKNASPQSLILFNLTSCKWAFNYYSKRSDLIKRIFPKEVNTFSEKNKGDTRQTEERYDKVWVIVSHGNIDEKLITDIDRNSYGLLQIKTYKGIKIYQFEKNK